jgi:hypothetical protein
LVVLATKSPRPKVSQRNPKSVFEACRGKGDVS